MKHVSQFLSFNFVCANVDYKTKIGIEKQKKWDLLYHAY